MIEKNIHKMFHRKIISVLVHCGKSINFFHTRCNSSEFNEEEMKCKIFNSEQRHMKNIYIKIEIITDTCYFMYQCSKCVAHIVNQTHD